MPDMIPESEAVVDATFANDVGNCIGNIDELGVPTRVDVQDLCKRPHPMHRYPGIRCAPIRTRLGAMRGPVHMGGP